jgi:hypothetical protein
MNEYKIKRKNDAFIFFYPLKAFRELRFSEFEKNFFKKICLFLKIALIFAIPKRENEFFNNAEVAQLVEHNLAKVGVAGSNLVFCSKNFQA